MILIHNLEDMLVGWQKVATQYHMTIYVFKVGEGAWGAVTNKSQGVGAHTQTINPEGPALKFDTESHGRSSTVETKV
jgi:hypothetical protein